MFKDILKIFSGKDKIIELSHRTFNPKMFVSDIHQQKLEADGYVHLTDIVETELINSLLKVYHEASDRFDFFGNSHDFLNTMALKESEVKKYIQTNTKPVIRPFLSSFLITENISSPFGAAFCINPPNAIHPCNPHQDPAYVDESTGYSLIVWVPLSDINMENGCLHVLPKSHLWGNKNRSISMDWAFERFSEELWKYLIPVETKLGDLIVFDAALIHASNTNTTDINRIAVNIPVLPVQEKMITYFSSGENEGYQYEIDEGFYMDEFLFNKPSDRYRRSKKMKLNNLYSMKDVHRLIGLTEN
jgi:hypothetical protein